MAGQGRFSLRYFAEQAGEAATVRAVNEALAADPELAATLQALLAALEQETGEEPSS